MKKETYFTCRIKFSNLTTTPLLLAVTRGHVEIIDILLSRMDIDVNCQDEQGRTPLTRAIFENKGEAASVLLNHRGVDVNDPDFEGLSPLMQAIMAGNEELVATLLEHPEVDPNFRLEKNEHNLVNLVEDYVLAGPLNPA